MCVVQSLMDRLPKLKAEMALAQAQVVALPHMKQLDRERWYNRQAHLVEPVAEQSETWMPFTFNGVPMGLAGLKMKVAGALGSGYST